MALARSASGPGGLSINTGAANLFGSGAAASQPAASGGLFGAATTQPAATTTATPSLFTPPTATGGGLFGGAAAKPAAGGLFGASTATTQPAAAAGGGLFGAAAAPAAATTAAPAGGLFGTTAAAKPASGLFGAAAAPATAAPAAGGLFGAAAAPATAAPASGLFGAPAAASATAAPTGGLFGTPAAAAKTAPTGGLFGASTAAASTAGQPQMVPGVRIDLSNLKGTTRFNDLHESLQRDIMAFDSLIQTYVEQKNQVAAFMPAHGDSLIAIPGDVRFVGRKYDGVSAALGEDLQAIQVLRETVRQDAEHARRSFQALDNQKLPAQFHTAGLWSGTTVAGGGGGGGDDEAGGRGRKTEATTGGGGADLISYFSQTGDDIGAQLRRLERNLGEIEVHMYGVQSGLLEQLQRVAQEGGDGAEGGGTGGHKVAELAAVLREFEDSILTVASVVGTAREDMTALQMGRYLGR